MNSKTLMETGSSEWLPLKTITLANLPSDKGAVVIIVDKELSGKQESDILYIGRTKKPSKRILGGYLAGYGGKNTKKINQLLFDQGYIEKAAVGWILTEKPRIMQEELLAKFKEEHGEYPVWNAKKKLSVKQKQAPPKRKEVPALKVKTPPTKASTVTKGTPKSKVASTRKSAANLESTAKAEMSKKEESAAETTEKAKASDTGMAT